MLRGPIGAASLVAGPVGPSVAGPPGPTGATGATGPTGADSTVAGPPGDAEDKLGTDLQNVSESLTLSQKRNFRVRASIPIYSTGTSFPSNPVINDVHEFSDTASSITAKDFNGTDDITSAARADVFKFDGTNWIKQSDDLVGTSTSTVSSSSSTYTTGSDVPTTGVVEDDLFEYNEDATGQIGLVDYNGVTSITNVSRGDVFKYDGDLWVKQSESGGGEDGNASEILLATGSFNWGANGAQGDAADATIRLTRSLTEDDDEKLFAISVRVGSDSGNKRAPFPPIRSRWVRLLDRVFYPGGDQPVSSGDHVSFVSIRNEDNDVFAHARWNMYYSGTKVTDLDGALNDAAGPLDIDVESATDLSVNDDIYIDVEKFTITAIEDNTLTVNRGVSGTTGVAHLDGADVYLDDKRGYFFTQTNASQEDVTDIDVLLFGSGETMSSSSSSQQQQGTSPAVNVTLTLYQRSPSEPDDPPLVWSDDGYTDALLGDWERDEDSTSGTDTLWIAVATATQPSGSSSWSQTSWLKEALDLQRQFSETADATTGDTTKTDDHLYQRFRIAGGIWSDWFPIGDAVVKNLFVWNKIGSTLHLNSDTDKKMSFSPNINLDGYRELRIVCREFSNWSNWNAGIFNTWQSVRIPVSQITLSSHSTSAPTGHSNSADLYCRFTRGITPVLEWTPTDTDGGGNSDTRFKLTFQRSSTSLTLADRNMARLWVWDRSANWIKKKFEFYVR